MGFAAVAAVAAKAAATAAQSVRFPGLAAAAFVAAAGVVEDVEVDTVPDCCFGIVLDFSSWILTSGHVVVPDWWLAVVLVWWPPLVLD